FGKTEGTCAPTLQHYLLMSLPATFVITTNYDDLLERALLGLRKFPVRVVEPHDVLRPGNGRGPTSSSSTETPRPARASSSSGMTTRGSSPIVPRWRYSSKDCSS